MKVSDICVGDWIEDGYKKSQVTSITCDGIVETTAAISNIEVIDAIPLTEEILVKNGFVEVELTDSYELNTDYYEIEVWNYSDGLWVVIVHWIEFSSTPESKATVSYVHQLQHLLRLCGIEKEIEETNGEETTQIIEEKFDCSNLEKCEECDGLYHTRHLRLRDAEFWHGGDCNLDWPGL